MVSFPSFLLHFFYSALSFCSFQNFLAFVVAINLPFPADASYCIGFSKSFISTSSITLFLNLHQAPSPKIQRPRGPGLSFFTSHLSPLPSLRATASGILSWKDPRTKRLRYKGRASAIKSENVQATSIKHPFETVVRMQGT